jgi:hypothetical protein
MFVARRTLAYSRLPIPQPRHSVLAIFSLVASCLASSGILLVILAWRAGMLRAHGGASTLVLSLASMALGAGCILGFTSFFDSDRRRILALYAVLIALADFAAIFLISFR